MADGGGRVMMVSNGVRYIAVCKRVKVGHIESCQFCPGHISCQQDRGNALLGDRVFPDVDCQALQGSHIERGLVQEAPQVHYPFATIITVPTTAGILDG